MGQRAIQDDVAVTRWEFRRNCCLTPRQLGRSALATGFVCAALGGCFWWLGYPWVAFFAALEVGGLGTALLVYARHACDREVLTLHGDRLRVEREYGGRRERIDLQARWVRVDTSAAAGGRMSLCDRGRAVPVGRHLPASMQHRLAREIRVALNASRQGGGEADARTVA
jgi:uncharacterized membrane protein